MNVRIALNMNFKNLSTLFHNVKIIFKLNVVLLAVSPVFCDVGSSCDEAASLVTTFSGSVIMHT